MPGFRSHELALGRPLGLSRLGLFRPLADLSQKPHATADPGAAPNKGGRPKAEAPKVHIGFRLAADVVESLKAKRPWLQCPRRRGAARRRVRRREKGAREKGRRHARDASEKAGMTMDERQTARIRDRNAAARGAAKAARSAGLEANSSSSGPHSSPGPHNTGGTQFLLSENGTSSNGTRTASRTTVVNI
jgi:hypothetical protein